MKRSAGALCWVLFFLSKTLTAEEIIVYYANETLLSTEAKENTDQIVSWLRGSEYEHIAESILFDERHFPEAVASEIQKLIKISQFYKVFVFTNTLAVQGKYVSHYRGERKEYSDLKLPVYPSYIAQSQPLTEISSFQIVLSIVADKAQSSEVVFISKSHGNKDYALIPRVAIDTMGRNKTEFFDYLSGVESAFPFVAGSKVHEILSAIDQVRGILFPVFYLEACNLHGGIQSKLIVPRNVETLYSPNFSADFLTLNYSEILGRLESKTGLVEAFRMQLDKDLSRGGEKTIQIYNVNFIWNFVHWLPLAVLTVAFLWKTLMKRPQ